MRVIFTRQQIDLVGEWFPGLAGSHASERLSARPTPRGGGGLRVPICIDIYLWCVTQLRSVGILSPSGRVFGCFAIHVGKYVSDDTRRVSGVYLISDSPPTVVP